MSEPFLLRGGDQGCLLIHGFTGNPSEMRGLGEYLADAGHTVFGMRLPGHGGNPTDLAAVAWRDWLAAVIDAHAYMAEQCARVSVVGFSLGGSLGLLLATRRPLDRLVLLATPTRLQGDWRVNLLGVVRHTTPWFYPLQRADFSDPEVREQVARHAPDANLDDPAVQAEIRKAARISLHAIDEARLAFAAGRAALPAVRTPVLVMQGRNDLVAPAESPDAIISQIGSEQRELVWWENTGHQLLVIGPHRKAIYRRIAEFLAER